jgi:hypothetical protein
MARASLLDADTEAGTTLRLDPAWRLVAQGERLRASKDWPTAVRSWVCAGRREPSGAKSGVLINAAASDAKRPR